MRSFQGFSKLTCGLAKVFSRAPITPSPQQKPLSAGGAVNNSFCQSLLSGLYCLLVVCAFFSCSISEAEQPLIPHPMNRSDKRSGDVAICMIFQNERPFIKEWIDYHKMIGVSHFYLYDNGSDDDPTSLLLPYLQRGEIELFYFFERTQEAKEHNELQRRAYDHALSLARGVNGWLAIIDADEFICLPKGGKLPSFLKRYQYAGGLAVHWVMYGSSGVQSLAPGDLQIEKLVRRAPTSWPENFLFKSIVRPSRVERSGIHSSHYLPGFYPVFADHSRVTPTPKFKKPPINRIRINHYWWRSEDYFNLVKRPRRAGWLARYSDAEVDHLRSVYNSVKDRSMQRAVKKMKRLERKTKGREQEQNENSLELLP